MRHLSAVHYFDQQGKEHVDKNKKRSRVGFIQAVKKQKLADTNTFRLGDWQACYLQFAQFKRTLSARDFSLERTPSYNVKYIPSFA